MIAYMVNDCIYVDRNTLETLCCTLGCKQVKQCVVEGDANTAFMFNVALHVHVVYRPKDDKGAQIYLLHVPLTQIKS